METGVLGLVGCSVFAVGIFISLIRTMARGRDDDANDMRFLLLIGPATYVAYSVSANAALTNSSVNTWAVLVASMLALTPRFQPRRVRRIVP
jgi:O-antigen ligase